MLIIVLVLLPDPCLAFIKWNSTLAGKSKSPTLLYTVVGMSEGQSASCVAGSKSVVFRVIVCDIGRIACVTAVLLFSLDSIPLTGGQFMRDVYIEGTTICCLSLTSLYNNLNRIEVLVLCVSVLLFFLLNL